MGWSDGPSQGPATWESSPKYKWEPWFAWHPVQIHGRRKWMTRVWRKQIEMYGDAKNEPPCYEYGTLFDVIKGEQ